MTTGCDQTSMRITRVNHAGECGAISIYRAQIWVARLTAPHLLPFLCEALAHEIKHRESFAGVIRAREFQASHCLFIWRLGGYILGFLTAVFGPVGIYLCTAAVERTVHQHLQVQMAFLRGKDDQLYNVIKCIHREEMAHLEFAENGMQECSRFMLLADGVISWLTQAAIFLSTAGESRVLRRLLG